MTQAKGGEIRRSGRALGCVYTTFVCARGPCRKNSSYPQSSTLWVSKAENNADVAWCVPSSTLQLGSAYWHTLNGSYMTFFQHLVGREGAGNGGVSPEVLPSTVEGNGDRPLSHPVTASP